MTSRAGDGTSPGAGTTRRNLDPELAALQVLMPAIDIGDPVAARRTEEFVTHEMRFARDDVETQDESAVRRDGTPLALRVYRPYGTAATLPVLLFFHGGSFVTGGLHSEDTRCELYAHEARCAVVAVEYRLAPEQPFPAALHDCVDALRWVRASADAGKIDRTRVAVGGLSAGGGLAAATALVNRDEGGAELMLQLLLHPVLDARMTSRSLGQLVDTPVLTAETVRTLWRSYLGTHAAAGAAEIPPYASPALHHDLANLPPAFVSAAEFDPLRDEALDYARRMLDAGVPVDLRHYARAFHSFDSYTATRIARAALTDQVNALRAAFG